MKLNPKHVEILRLLEQGWEIGIERGLECNVRMQKGGESKGVYLSMFRAMENHGLIAPNNEPPGTSPNHYHITAKGKLAIFEL
jgi:hypothetical protein